MAQGKGPTSKIWRNGSLVDWDDANVHVMAHAIHYGSSVFEGMRCYEGPQHGSVFRNVDLLATKHCVDSRAQAALVRESHQQLQRLIRNPIL